LDAWWAAMSDLKRAKITRTKITRAKAPDGCPPRALGIAINTINTINTIPDRRDPPYFT
jgi:hypothetical protein